MAYYDKAEADRKLAAKEKYEELKKMLYRTDSDLKLNDFLGAYTHMRDMEIKLEEQEKELKKYRSFFATLSNLIPRQPSIHDVIG